MSNPYINDLMPGEQYGMPTSTPQTLQRRSRLAQQLLEQGQQPLEGQMVSGRYVAPSWTQGLAKLLSSYQGGKIMGDINKQEQGMAQSKQKAIADILAQSQPKTVEGQPVTTETMPAYTPDQMDRFGSPMPDVQRQPEVTTNTPTRTETPEEIQARLRPLIYQAVGQYGNDPALQLALGDLNYQRERGARKEDITDQRGYEEKLYNRGRQDKLSDTEAERKYNDIVRKEQQGFQVSQQDRQFAQQFQMQAQNQGFQAQQQAKSQQFQAGQNALSRDNAMQIADVKAKQTQQPKLTEDMRSTGQYAQRMQAAENLMSGNNSQKPGIIEAGAGILGETSANLARSPERQKALQAQRDWVRAKLRKESGAAIGKDEMDKEISTYFPQIGDSPEVIAQKQQSRQQAMTGMIQSAGGAYNPPENSNPRVVDW